MKASQIEIGGRYTVKVSGEVVPVRVTRTVEIPRGRRYVDGWEGVNETTGRTIRIRSAQRFRSKVMDGVGIAKPDGTAATMEELELTDDERRDLLECEGHPAGAFDPMGETVYCDGSCQSLKVAS